MEKRETKGWIFIIVLVVVVILGVKIAYSKWNIKAKQVEFDLVYNTELFAGADEYWDEKYANEESDIEGWSKLDKKNAGLGVVDGSDSDMDGLSDKEEIEKYHSDPLKTSTAGDLYTDGYKVANGLDLNTYYEDSTIEYLYNIPNEVTLYPASASDNLTDIRELSLKDEPAFKTYSLSGYSGNKIEINVDDIINDENIKESKLGCYLYDLRTCDYDYNIDYKVKNGILTINNEFDASNSYFICITKKSLIPSRVSQFLFNDAISDGYRKLLAAEDFAIFEGHHVNSEDGILIYILPITYPLFRGGIKPLAYYNVTDNSEQNAKTIKDITWLAKEQMSCDDTEVKLKESSMVKIITIYNKLEGIANGFFNMRNDSFFNNGFFAYQLMSEYNDLHYSKPEEPHVYRGNSNFDIVEETLPFRNFGTVFSTGGNCMGISTLVAKLHNNNSIPSSGKSESLDIEWNLAIDEENNTLLDPGLSDYKDSEFIKNHYTSNKIVNANLSEGEKEFIKMIGGYFWDGNTIIEESCKPITENDKGYKLNNLREVCKKYLNKKTLILGMNYIDDEGVMHGHAVNIYGFEDEIDKGGVMTINIADCNFVGEDNKNLRVLILPKDDGTFNFVYITNKVDNYGYSSDKGHDYYFVITDEDHNILFGTDDDISHKIIGTPAEKSIISVDEFDEKEKPLNFFDWY